MEKKLLRKSKGQWISVSMAIVAAVAVGMYQDGQVVFAAEGENPITEEVKLNTNEEQSENEIEKFESPTEKNISQPQENSEITSPSINNDHEQENANEEVETPAETPITEEDQQTNHSEETELLVNEDTVVEHTAQPQNELKEETNLSERQETSVSSPQTRLRALPLVDGTEEISEKEQEVKEDQTETSKTETDNKTAEDQTTEAKSENQTETSKEEATKTVTDESKESHQSKTENKQHSDTSAPTKTAEVENTPKITMYASRAVPEEKKEEKAPTYTVKKGDNLYRIAKDHNVSLDNLKTWNKLQSNLILPGQNIAITDPNQRRDKNDSTSRVHQVKSGDNLYRIAKNHGISLDNLKRWNNLTSNMIHPGDELIVSKPQTTRETSIKQYQVSRGDNLYRIAKNHGISLSDLKRWNNLTSNMIHPGDKLIVSSPKTTSTTQIPARYYEISRGDNLYRIAKNHGISLSDLKRWNNLTSNMIHPGERLIVSQPSQSTTVTQTQTQADHYRVNRGDNLYRIAQRYGVNVSDLRKWNKLSSNLIHPGDQLIVSQPQSVTTQVSATSYKVSQGDNLYRIAKNHGISLNDLKRWNNLTSNMIHPGDQLIVSKPTTTTTTITPQPSSNKTYQVSRGDNLYRIAQRYGVSIDNLRKWNNLSGNMIHPGDQLIVSKPTATTPAQPAANKTYKVSQGDNLYRIAQRYGVSVDNLRRWNNLSGNMIHPGDQLIVSTPTTSTQTKPVASSKNLPDLSKVQAKSVNYDVKLNGKVESFRASRDLSKSAIDVKNYFGQRFTVTKEFETAGSKYLELSRNGQVVGYVPASASVEVPQGRSVVFLDAGHGGSDPGAVYGGVTEASLNLNITNKLKSALENQGYIVHLTRTGNQTVSLQDRSKTSNEIMPDLFLSVHHNAGGRGAQGIMTLYHDPSIDEPGYVTPSYHRGTNVIPEGKRLATTLQNALVQETGANNLGARPQNLWVTRNADVPAALVELGFMDSSSELSRLRTPSYQNKLVSGLVKGVNRFLNR